MLSLLVVGDDVVHWVALGVIEGDGSEGEFGKNSEVGGILVQEEGLQIPDALEGVSVDDLKPEGLLAGLSHGGDTSDHEERLASSEGDGIMALGVVSEEGDLVVFDWLGRVDTTVDLGLLIDEVSLLSKDDKRSLVEELHVGS